MIKAIVGANWGDEGKGKITDVCAEKADVVVRFQGGSNAGHTIINDKGRFALHQLPSGVFFSNVTNIIANGGALNISYLADEIKGVKDKGVSFNLLISDRVQVLLPYHVLLDQYEEERLADQKFGSTKSGIAPLYSDKYAKIGIQLWQLFDEEFLIQKLKIVLSKLNVIFRELYKKEELSLESLMSEIRRCREIVAPYVADTGKFLRRAIKEDKTIILEGQLGALRDVDHGIYPFVTSSSTLAGAAATGAGIPAYSITNIIAVTKAYSSAVGEGPFVVELFGEEAHDLRSRGGDNGEYGATTGRPRRVGYFDAVATRYGVEIQGATEIVLTAIDVLGYLDKIPVCTGYEIEGKIVKDFPTTNKLYQAKPVFTYLKGWKKDIRGINKYEELPEEALEYIAFIEKELHTKITMVSTGPKREDIIYLK